MLAFLGSFKNTHTFTPLLNYFHLIYLVFHPSPVQFHSLIF